MSAVPPGSTIGILGGGQLGRMLAVAAAQLGYRCHIFAPEAHSVAAEVSADWTRAQYGDRDALHRFAASVDVVTYEFENIDVLPIEELADHVRVHPNVTALAIAQDRLREKDYIRDHGGRPAPYREVSNRAQLDAAIADIGLPAILKTCRFGYDGKGQVRIYTPDDAAEAWAAVKGAPCVLEGFIQFEREFSVLAVRGQDGKMAFWDTPQNRHDDGILARSFVPAHPMIITQQDEARAIAGRVMADLDYVGVAAFEFFATDNGPVFNEMAPRVHNSGHWTIEGALTSQFENHIRAICGLPLGDTGLAADKVIMDNLIGDQALAWHELLADPANHLHLYGKGEARPGRKMGHLTRLEFD
ncbi:5-(carboxyamino)imidazole ribonucleotide synthase [Aquisediminimonas sediminicola]|uniref:5-(carboxyamino)imidazole ribonucleotide synthase n=1 Tax=Alteraquisediminimonas sediminicola TaxID=2676787 RepID=UPI001C8DA5BB|nr:5-(carboxyamino)imidazole ribonucleotide synthase [Aquisediminimonas sediminicola]